jgi:hypothetical protein
LETGDELRFGGATSVLRAAFLSVPEENGDWSAWQAVALAAATGKGSLCLVGSKPFVLPEVDLRVFAPDGAYLVGVFEDADPRSVAHQWEIAPGFRLLFADGSYCGWVLVDPIVRLRSDPCSPQVEDFTPEGQEGTLLAEFFSLVHEDSMDELYAGDAALKAKLQELRNRIVAPAQNPALEALCEKIDDLLDRWF